MACGAGAQCDPDRYHGVGLSSASTEGNGPGSWELGLQRAKGLQVLPGQVRTGAALAGLPSTGTRGR